MPVDPTEVAALVVRELEVAAVGWTSSDDATELPVDATKVLGV